MIYFDIDGFKSINDRFGHSEGDKALAAFAGNMRSTFRQSDVLGRMGGDEFVVLLTNTAIEPARDVISRFRQSLDKHGKDANQEYSIAFCDGIVPIDYEKDYSIDALLVQADNLMYERKHTQHSNT